jgi:PhnB protein
MIKMNSYLNFDGKAEEAFNFYKSVLGGEFTEIMRMSDVPESEKFADDEKDRIMHISLAINDGTKLMASDTIPSFGHIIEEGNNVQLSIHPSSREETEKIFYGLSEGGKVEMALEDTFWGAYFGSFKDKYGINWMINFDIRNT